MKDLKGLERGVADEGGAVMSRSESVDELELLRSLMSQVLIAGGLVEEGTPVSVRNLRQMVAEVCDRIRVYEPGVGDQVRAFGGRLFRAWWAETAGQRAARLESLLDASISTGLVEQRQVGRGCGSDCTCIRAGAARDAWCLGLTKNGREVF